jgi:hypothetical protein
MRQIGRTSALVVLFVAFASAPASAADLELNCVGTFHGPDGLETPAEFGFAFQFREASVVIALRHSRLRQLGMNGVIEGKVSVDATSFSIDAGPEFGGLSNPRGEEVRGMVSRTTGFAGLSLGAPVGGMIAGQCTPVAVRF